MVLVELPMEERASVMGELPDKKPRAARFLRQRLRVSNDSEAFVALAPRCAIFRVGDKRAD